MLPLTVMTLMSFYPNREEIEKQKAKERYMKMHLAGKTEQAKADLARLAIIRKQREEAARKKEEERKGRSEPVRPCNSSLTGFGQDPELPVRLERLRSDSCLLTHASQ